MHVSVTRVNTGDQPIDKASVVGEEMLRWLRDIEGFQGFMLISRPGTTLGLTFWATREAEEAHRPARIQFAQRMTSLAGVEIEEMVDYELTFAHVGPLLAEAG